MLRQDNSNETRQETHGRRLIERIKAAHVRPTQFRLGGMLIAMIVLSLLFAVARASSGGFLAFFVGLYAIAYGMMPLVAYAVYLYFNTFEAPRRRILAMLTAVVVPLPAWVYGYWESNIWEVALVAWWTMILVWLPEVLCLIALRWAVFRRRRRRSIHLPAELSDER